MIQYGTIRRIGSNRVDVQLAGSAATLSGVEVSAQVSWDLLAVGTRVLVDMVNSRPVVLHTLADNPLFYTPQAQTYDGIVQNALLADGSVPLAGNLPVLPGVTVDGYDISLLGQAVVNLQAADTIARTGYTVMTHSTHLVETIDADATEIVVRDNILATNEQLVVSNTSGQIEWMRATDAGTATLDDDGALCYRYTVTRRVDTNPGGLYTGWAAATLVNGGTFRGFIAFDNRHNASGSPSMRFVTWTDSPPTNVEHVVRMGNMNGILGLGSTDYGFAVGKLTTADKYIAYNTTTDDLHLHNASLAVTDAAGSEVFRVYSRYEAGHAPGDLVAGMAGGAQWNVLPEAGEINLSNLAGKVLWFTPTESRIGGLLSVGDSPGPQVQLGMLNGAAFIAARNLAGVAQFLVETNPATGNVHVFQGNPKPQGNWTEFENGVLTVDGTIRARDGVFLGTLSFASTGRIVIQSPDDPQRYGEILPHGQIGRTTRADGSQYSSMVMAWAPLVVQTSPGVNRTFLAGELLLGDPTYGNFQVKRSGMMGMYSGETPVAYVTSAGSFYGLGEMHASNDRVALGEPNRGVRINRLTLSDEPQGEGRDPEGGEAGEPTTSLLSYMSGATSIWTMDAWQDTASLWNVGTVPPTQINYNRDVLKLKSGSPVNADGLSLLQVRNIAKREATIDLVAYGNWDDTYGTQQYAEIILYAGRHTTTAQWNHSRIRLDANTIQLMSKGVNPSQGSETLTDGLFAFADGTGWNPGGGKGLYWRQAGTWWQICSDTGIPGGVGGSYIATSGATVGATAQSQKFTRGVNLIAQPNLSDPSIVEWKDAGGNQVAYLQGLHTDSNFFQLNVDAHGAAQYEAATVNVNAFGAASAPGTVKLSAYGGGSLVNPASLTLTQTSTGAGTVVISNAAFVPLMDGTGALQMKDASGTATILNIDTTNKRVGIGTATPGAPLHIYGDGNMNQWMESVSGRANTVLCSGANKFARFIMVQGGSFSGGDYYGDSRFDVGLGEDATGNFYIGSADLDSKWFSITPSGNVGIGTTNPGAPLHIEKTGTGSMIGLALSNRTLVEGDEIVIDFCANNQAPGVRSAQIAGVCWGGNNMGLAFKTEYGNAATTRMVIDYLGQVGIGTLAPGQALDVTGYGKFSSGLIAPVLKPASDSTTALQIMDAGSNAFVVFDTTNKRVGIGVATPSTVLDIEGSVASAGLRVRLKNTNAAGSADQFFFNDTNAYLGWQLFGSSYTGYSFGIARAGFARLVSNSSVGFGVGTETGGGPLILGTQNLERMRIDAATGNVGINNTNPLYTLDVGGTGAFSSGLVAPVWKPAADSTAGLTIQNAAGQALATFDTTNKRLLVGSGVTPLFDTEFMGPVGGSYNFSISSDPTRTAQLLLGAYGDGWPFVKGIGPAVQWGIGVLEDADANTFSIANFTPGGKMGFWAADEGSSYYQIMVIDPAGKVGIGTSTPGTRLMVGDGSAALGAIGGIHALAVSTDTNTSAVAIAAENKQASSAYTGAFAALYSNDGAAMASGDRLGGFLFGGSSSASNLRNSVLVAAFASEDWVNGSAYGSYLRFETTVNGGTTRSEKMRITGDGKVGIGRTNPDELLHVQGWGKFLSGVNAPVWKLPFDSTTGLMILNAAGNAISVWDTVNKNVLIGGDYIPSYPLEVTGTAGGAICLTNGSTRSVVMRLGITDDWPSIFGGGINCATAWGIGAIEDTDPSTFSIVNFRPGNLTSIWTMDGDNVLHQALTLIGDGLIGANVTDPGAVVDVAGSTETYASLRIRAGSAPSSPNNGDIWSDGKELYIYANGMVCKFDLTPV